MKIDIIAVKKIIREQVGLLCENIKAEVESKEYGAATFEINNHAVRFRIAKTTPTKQGQFVTLWKRIGNGPIMPFDEVDSLDFFITAVSNGSHAGLFIFPKAVLLEKNIISFHKQGGKRAIRVYPSWDIVDNRQARATQVWQLRYFVQVQSDESCDENILQKLLFLKS